MRGTTRIPQAILPHALTSAMSDMTKMDVTAAQRTWLLQQLLLESADAEEPLTPTTESHSERKSEQFSTSGSRGSHHSDSAALSPVPWPAEASPGKVSKETQVTVCLRLPDGAQLGCTLNWIGRTSPYIYALALGGALERTGAKRPILKRSAPSHVN